jgi:hypothetical protein
MMWSFFGQGMGKGPMMVLGQFWKGFSRNHDWVLNGPKLQNAEDVVTLMCIHLSSQPETSYTRERKPITCVFWHVNTIDVDHQTKYTCDSMKGSWDLHRVKSISICDVNKMLKKDSFCFCCFCFDFNYKNCVNLAWT